MEAYKMSLNEHNCKESFINWLMYNKNCSESQAHLYCAYLNIVETFANRTRVFNGSIFEIQKSNLPVVEKKILNNKIFFISNRKNFGSIKNAVNNLKEYLLDTDGIFDEDYTPQAFEKWLKSQGMVDQSCKLYVYAIRNAESYMKEHCFKSSYIYSVNKETAANTIKVLLEDDEYTSHSKTNCAALRKYLQYIGIESPKDSISALSFEEKMGDKEKEFYNWLANKGLSKGTCRGYVTGIWACESYAKENGFMNSDIYRANKLDAYNLILLLLSDDQFVKLHGGYRSLLKRYLSFIGFEIEEPKKQISFELTMNDGELEFYSWLSKEGLSESSCRGYVTNIRACERYASQNNYDWCSLTGYDRDASIDLVLKLLDDNQFTLKHKAYFSVLKKFLKYMNYDFSDTSENVDADLSIDEKSFILESFESWLINTGLARITCRSYLSALKSAENYAKEKRLTPCEIFTEDKAMAAQTINNLVADSEYLVTHKMYLSVFKKYMEYIGYEIDTPKRKDKPKSYDESLQLKHPLLYQKLYSVSKIYDEVEGHSIERIMQLAGGGASEDVYREFLDNISWATKVELDMYSFSPKAVPFHKLKNSKPIESPIILDPIHVIPDFNQDNYVLVLNRRFQNGITCDSIDLEKFRLAYEDFFDEQISLADDELTIAIETCGLSYKGKVFPAEAVIDSITKEKLAAYIKNAFSSGKQMIYYKAIYSDMEDDFICCFNLADEEMLREYIKFSFKDDGYFFFDQYMSVTESVKVDNAAEIVDFLLSYGKPATTEIICAALSHIPSESIVNELHFGQNFIANAIGEYFHSDIFEASVEEIEKIKTIISEMIEENGYANWLKVYDTIRNLMPLFIENNIYLSYLGVRKCVVNYLEDTYDFNKNIISPKGEELNRADIFKQFAKNHETFTLDEVNDIAIELGGKIAFNALSMFAVRVSHDLFVNKSLIHFDVYAADNAIESYISNRFILIGEIDSFMAFPTVGYEWNEYLLESFLLSYSHRFSLLSKGQSNDRVTGVVTKTNGGIGSLEEACVIALAESNCELKKEPALKFLAEKGYITRKRYGEIEAVMKKAAIVRNGKE